MSPTLLVLAAGMGSRYGGLKQMESVGPHGEFVIDYAVYDALRAGFGKVVFVISRAMEATFRETIATRLPRGLEVACAFQEMDSLPPGFEVPADRKKPWGTGHAIWSARECVGGPFLVINADDFYGAAAYQTAAEHIGTCGAGVPPAVATGPVTPQAVATGTVTPQAVATETVTLRDEFFMVGYSLRTTVSPHGPVARGVCAVDHDGFLADIVERTGIRVDAAGSIYTAEEAGRRRAFTGDEIVSMNMWGFTPSIFAHLERLFREFLRANGALPTSGRCPAAEFYIPTAVGQLIQQRAARVKVLRTSAADWVGVTYIQDKPVVVERIRSLTEGGVYPAPLWPGKAK